MTIAQPRTRPNNETRARRALALAGERFEEIAASPRGGSYTVPASGGGQRSYGVTYTAREESCSCPDWQIRGVSCYHVLAVCIVRAKTGICAGCARRFRHRELVECVEGMHDNLTYFDGDLLCPECADKAGVAR
jgi:hypothetical protein